MAEVVHVFPVDGGVYGISIDVRGIIDVETGRTYGIALFMETTAPGVIVTSLAGIFGLRAR